MRRVAASIVYINEKEFHNHVVELLNHQVTNHYPLEGEQPMTEWLGGTIEVRRSEEGVLEAYHQGRRLL